MIPNIRTILLVTMPAVYVATVMGCCNTQPPPPPPPPPVEPEFSSEVVQENNRGVALMLQFNFTAALEVFSALAQQHPDAADLQVNQAISQLNRQQTGDVKAAFALLEAVLEEEPQHPRALFCQGLLLLYRGDAAAASASFESIAAQDDKDAYAAYWLGQCFAEQQQYEEALEWYAKAAELDPYLRSAYYGSFVALRQLGRGDEAKERLGDYERLKNNLLARLAEFKYTRMGSKGEAVPIGATHPSVAERPEGAIFTDLEELKIAHAEKDIWKSDESHSVTVADINGDGRLDLFITSLSSEDGLHNAVCLGGDEGFRLVADHPLANIDEVNAALWGDYDNDGRTDVYLCRTGENQLWRAGEEGDWEDVTASTGTAAGEFNTIDGAMYDADHDGDLDLLLVQADGPVELLNNNRDGTFRSLAEELHITSDSGSSRGLVVADLDGDRDLDIVLLKSKPPHEILINDRAWNYEPADASFDALRNATIDVAVAADLNADGVTEIVLASGNQIGSCQPGSDGAWQYAKLAAIEQLSTIRQIVVQDVDGDGQADLIVSGPEGWVVVSPGSGSALPTQQFYPAQLDAIAVAPLGGDQGVSLIGLRDEHAPNIWHPGPGRFKFARIAFVGRLNEADQLRSNASGIGVQAAARIGSHRTSFAGIRNSSGPGQSLTPLSVGLAGGEAIDYITLRWPDGVLQTEIAVSPGPHTVSETQRQLSSCPVLFCHNGKEFAFATDLLGVGGLGFATGRNEYAPATPHENILLPEGALVAVDNVLRLKLTEPMEEACYFDHVELVAYDLPPGWQMTLDERMNIAGPPATGKEIYFRRRLTPVGAVNDRGADVLSKLSQVDHKAAPPGVHDSRFLGRTEEHSIELTFDSALDELPQPALLAHGWVEYPYSQTMFAAWQAGVTFDAPSIEARGDDGQWITIWEQFGYPAGMPREISVPLPDLPKGCRMLRITTNQEIYWDYLAVVGGEECPQAKMNRLPLKRAELGECGFPKWTYGPQRVPKFDWNNRAPLWDTRHQSGYYTRFGSVDALVNRRDSAVAIFGPGEEIDFQFAAPTAQLDTGWKRRYVLRTSGWCKDMDLYTEQGDTVAPLPTHKELTTEEEALRRQLHQRFNTRFRSGH